MNKRHLSPQTSVHVAFLFLVGSSLAITIAAFAELSITTVMEVIATDLGGFRFYPMAFGMAACGQLISTALAGAWCDTRSPRYSLVTGGLTFILGVLMCALAPNMWVLIAGRFSTGLGAGFLMVPMYVLVGSLLSRGKQPMAFAAFAAAWVIPSLLGPGLAGWLVEHISWRWIFGFTLIVTVPIALIILALLRFIENRHASLSYRAKQTAISASVAGISIVFLQFATIQSTWWTMAVAIASVIAILTAIRYLFPMGTLRLRRGLPSVIASRGLVNAAYMATMTSLPVILTHARGWSPKAAGIAVTVGSITYALGSLIQSRIKNEMRRLVLPLYGAVMVTIGVALAGLIAFQWAPAIVAIIGWGIAGLGVGISYSALAVRGLAEVSAARHGEVSSDLQLADSMGAAIAFGVITGIFGALSEASGPWPYLPGPLIALLFALFATEAGRRLTR